MRKPAWWWRPLLARHNTAARRRRQAFRRCTALWDGLGRSRPVRHKLTCYASSPETERSDARASADTQSDWALEAKPGGTHHGLVPMERGLSPVRWPYIVREATTTSATRRSRVATRVLHVVPGNSERSGALACALRESQLCVGGHRWNVAARSCTEAERPLANMVPL